MRAFSTSVSNKVKKENILRYGEQNTNVRKRPSSLHEPVKHSPLPEPLGHLYNNRRLFLWD
jgi:hypothetical protein